MHSHLKKETEVIQESRKGGGFRQNKQLNCHSGPHFSIYPSVVIKPEKEGENEEQISLVR